MSLTGRLAYLLDDLDLSQVSRRFLSRHGHPDWSPTPAVYTIQSDALTCLVTLIEAEYRKLLALKVAHGDTHGRVFGVPSALLEFWEAHVLDTEAYAEMQDRVGMRIHYHPEMRGGGGNQDSCARRMHNTIVCYQARFGDKYRSGYLPELVWGAHWARVAMGDSDATSGGGSGQHPDQDQGTWRQMLRTLATVWSPGQDAVAPVLSVSVAVRAVFESRGERSHFDIKFKEDVCVWQVKRVLEMLTGIPARAQELKCEYVCYANSVMYNNNGFLMRNFGGRTNWDLSMRHVVRMRGC